MPKTTRAQPNGRPEAAAAPGRRERKSVQRQAAVDAALDLAGREGAPGLTMRRLGDALQVDPTTLYRLFRDKDELLLAVYDREIELVLDAIGPVDMTEPWQQLLLRVADAIWTGLNQYPAITALTFARTSGGPAERRVVELALAAFMRGGLTPAQTVLYYRAFVDAALGLCGQNAVFATLEPEVQEKDATAWTRIYAQLPEHEYPRAREHITDLISIQDRTIYDAVINAVLAAAERTAQENRPA